METKLFNFLVGLFAVVVTPVIFGLMYYGYYISYHYIFNK